MARAKAKVNGSSIMHTMRRADEYEKYSKIFRRRIVCCVAQQDFFWLVCTCSAERSTVYKVHREEKGCALVGRIRAPQMPLEGKSMKVLLAKFIGAQQGVHLTLGSLRVLQAFSPPQPFSHRTAFRRPPQRR